MFLYKFKIMVKANVCKEHYDRLDKKQWEHIRKFKRSRVPCDVSNCHNKNYALMVKWQEETEGHIILSQ